MAAIAVGFIPTAASLVVPVPPVISSLQDTQSFAFSLLLVPSMAVFSLIYTANNFNAWQIAENLIRQGTFITGVRPGLQTQQYIDSFVLKLTIAGIVFKSALLMAIWAGLRLARLDGDPVLLFSTLVVTISLANNIMAEINQWLVIGRYDSLLRKSATRHRSG